MSLICWSGGLDSTLVLRQLAAEARDGSKHHPHGVRALSVVHPQVAGHLPTIRAAREAIKNALRRSGLIVSYVEATIGHTHQAWSGDHAIGSAENPQALLWLTTAANYLKPDEDLYTGYIRGDDYWHKSSVAQTAFEWLQQLAGNTGRMVHPLEWETKADVIRRAKELELYRHCWWCEDKPKAIRGKPRPCGKCKSCQTNDAGLWLLARAGENATG